MIILYPRSIGTVSVTNTSVYQSDTDEFSLYKYPGIIVQQLNINQLNILPDMH